MNGQKRNKDTSMSTKKRNHPMTQIMIKKQVTSDPY